MAPLTTLALLTTLLSTPTTAAYTLKKDMSYKNFFDTFTFFSAPDPTYGFVQYQNESSAFSSGLARLDDDTKSVYLGVDSKSKDPNGRASVRLESDFSFNPPENGGTLLVADITHMPDNVCGSWPAFWLLGDQEWPNGGEIDILENVHDERDNMVTIHTGDGCKVTNATGGLDNCNILSPDEEKDHNGCSIKAPPPGGKIHSTYGVPFNLNGGGVYALEWTPTYIQVWFFPRNEPSLPSQSQLTESPDPSTWGPPLAKFQGSECDFTEKFKDLRIIFNTAFCGEWAGQKGVWDYSCKAKTGYEVCNDYVRNNPSVYEYSYWEIQGLRLFENAEDGGMKKRHVGEHGHRQARRHN